MYFSSLMSKCKTGVWPSNGDTTREPASTAMPVTPELTAATFNVPAPAFVNVPEAERSSNLDVP